MLVADPVSISLHPRFRGEAKPPEAIAHRGVQVERTGQDTYDVYCENSLEALVRAAELGLDAVEMDVIALPDAQGQTQLLVHHDNAWGRLFKQPDTQELLKNTDFDSARKAKYKPEGLRKSLQHMLKNENEPLVRWKDSPETRISTLAEVVDAVLAVKPDMKFYFEVKTKNNNTPFGTKGLEQSLVRFIQERGLQQQAVIISFNPWSLAKVKRLDSSIETGLDLAMNMTRRLKDRHLPVLMRMIKNLLRADAVMPAYEATSDAFVQAAHGRGLKIRPYVRKESLSEERLAWEKLLAQGVDGIVSNAPGELRAFLQSCKNAKKPD